MQQREATAAAAAVDGIGASVSALSSTAAAATGSGGSGGSGGSSNSEATTLVAHPRSKQTGEILGGTRVPDCSVCGLSAAMIDRVHPQDAEDFDHRCFVRCKCGVEAHHLCVSLNPSTNIVGLAAHAAVKNESSRTSLVLPNDWQCGVCAMESADTTGGDDAITIYGLTPSQWMLLPRVCTLCSHGANHVFRAGGVPLAFIPVLDENQQGCGWAHAICVFHTQTLMLPTEEDEGDSKAATIETLFALQRMTPEVKAAKKIIADADRTLAPSDKKPKKKNRRLDYQVKERTNLLQRLRKAKAKAQTKLNLYNEQGTCELCLLQSLRSSLCRCFHGNCGDSHSFHASCGFYKGMQFVWDYTNRYAENASDQTIKAAYCGIHSSTIDVQAKDAEVARRRSASKSSYRSSGRHSTSYATGADVGVHVSASRVCTTGTSSQQAPDDSFISIPTLQPSSLSGSLMLRKVPPSALCATMNNFCSAPDASSVAARLDVVTSTSASTAFAVSNVALGGVISHHATDVVVTHVAAAAATTTLSAAPTESSPLLSADNRPLQQSLTPAKRSRESIMHTLPTFLPEPNSDAIGSNRNLGSPFVGSWSVDNSVWLQEEFPEFCDFWLSMRSTDPPSDTRPGLASHVMDAIEIFGGKSSRLVVNGVRPFIAVTVAAPTNLKDFQRNLIASLELNSDNQLDALKVSRWVTEITSPETVGASETASLTHSFSARHTLKTQDADEYENVLMAEAEYCYPGDSPEWLSSDKPHARKLPQVARKSSSLQAKRDTERNTERQKRKKRKLRDVNTKVTCSNLFITHELDETPSTPSASDDESADPTYHSSRSSDSGSSSSSSEDEKESMLKSLKSVKSVAAGIDTGRKGANKASTNKGLTVTSSASPLLDDSKKVNTGHSPLLSSKNIAIATAATTSTTTHQSAAAAVAPKSQSTVLRSVEVRRAEFNPLMKVYNLTMGYAEKPTIPTHTMVLHDALPISFPSVDTERAICAYFQKHATVASSTMSGSCVVYILIWDATSLMQPLRTSLSSGVAQLLKLNIPSSLTHCSPSSLPTTQVAAVTTTPEISPVLKHYTPIACLVNNNKLQSDDDVADAFDNHWLALRDEEFHVIAKFALQQGIVSHVFLPVLLTCQKRPRSIEVVVSIVKSVHRLVKYLLQKPGQTLKASQEQIANLCKLDDFKGLERQLCSFHQSNMSTVVERTLVQTRSLLGLPDLASLRLPDLVSPRLPDLASPSTRSGYALFFDSTSAPDIKTASSPTGLAAAVQVRPDSSAISLASKSQGQLVLQRAAEHRSKPLPTLQPSTIDVSVLETEISRLSMLSFDGANVRVRDALLQSQQMLIRLRSSRVTQSSVPVSALVT